ncbi:MAG: molybdate ABC transporter permease subunit [Desulforhopalus sp.]|jgi:molybdate transport system permease protein|nr:molybdate ABC transporter permease subunit [Desulforhopalus sp.]HSL38739.1 molybdate ABC transporter permease subunit [Desulforhopalus sp.]
MHALTPADITAITLSLKVAVSTTILTLPPGFLVAYLLARTTFRGKAVIEGIVNLPLVLPPVVTGYLLLLLFGRNGWLGRFLGMFDISIIFTLKAAVIASAVVGFPLLVRAIRIGLESIDAQYIHAARSLGAGWWDSLFTITVPLCSRAIFAGMTLMFARSLGEFGATIILAGNMPGVTQTIPLAIFGYTSTPGGDAMALSLCLVSIALSFTVLLAGEAINRSMARKVQR